jgi:hypothetical protein
MITRYHTLRCPDCQRQKMVVIPSTTAFHCCRDWDVEVELQRDGMLVSVGETWTPAREELANCVWADAATPFADNH